MELAMALALPEPLAVPLALALMLIFIGVLDPEGKAESDSTLAPVGTVRNVDEEGEEEECSSILCAGVKVSSLNAQEEEPVSPFNKGV